MNGIDFIVDTNILLYLLQGNENLEKYEGNHFGISVITEIEMLGWQNINKQQKKIITDLINELTVFPLNDQVKNIAITLKQLNKIKTPDAIIASTAKWLQIPLLTADKDFKNIESIDAIIIDI